MIKKIFLLVVSFFLLTVQSMAIDIYSDVFYVSDGNTYLGTFLTAELNDNEKDYIREFLNSNKGLITYHPNAMAGSGNGICYLFNYVDSVSSTISIGSGGLAEVMFIGSSGQIVARGTVWSIESDGKLRYLYNADFSAGSWLSDAVIIGGSAATDLSFPSPVSSYAADFVGTVFLRDDGGLFSDSETDPDDGGGLLGFLSVFWENLKNFFIGLFVPSDGYFTQWYQSVKSAVDAKLSAITSLYNGLTGFFSGLTGQSVSVVLELPAGHLFAGSPAISVDIFATLGALLSFLRGVFTGIVVLFTMIICYKKLVTIFQE